MCPKGFDPIAPVLGYYTLTLKTSAAQGLISGYLKMTYNNEFFLFPANVSVWTGNECRKSFQGLNAFKTVTCAHGAQDYPGGIFDRIFDTHLIIFYDV